MASWPATAVAAFPGANGKIAFPQFQNVMTVNADGSGLASATSSAIEKGDPAWSPDGSTIVFTKGTAFSGQIVTVSVGSTQETVVATCSTCFGYMDPTWSPDGGKLAAVRFDGCPTDEWCESELLTMNADGSGEQQITNTSGFIEHPSWSPKGDRIVFVLDPPGDLGGLSDIYAVDPDGSDYGKLFESTADYPSWSPDGKRLAFRNGVKIATADPNGGGLIDLTAPPAGSVDSAPAWSPDGSKIAFLRAAGVSTTAYALHVMNSDGSNPQQIATATGGSVDMDLDWQPLHALDPYPRPGGATPLRVPLAPVYAQCTSPNSEHVAPLASPSCTPPTLLSSLLTTSSTGKGQGFVRYDAVPGNPATPADEADLSIQTSLSDVRNSSDGSDYAGRAILNATFRITDRASGFGGVSATGPAFGFSIPLDCQSTADPTIGGACNLQTSADTLLPGMVLEGKRSVIATRLIQILDVGVDGQIASSGCPPTCGTGDERPFVRAGVFAP